MLNFNNKLMLALMLSSSFAAKELIANNEELDEEGLVEEYENNDDNEEGVSKGSIIAGTLGTAALIAAGVYGYRNKENLSEMFSKKEDLFTNFIKLENEYIAEIDPAKQAYLLSKLDNEDYRINSLEKQKAIVKLNKQCAKSSEVDLINLYGELELERLNLENEHNEAVNAKALKQAGFDKDVNSEENQAKIKAAAEELEKAEKEINKDKEKLSKSEAVKTETEEAKKNLAKLKEEIKTKEANISKLNNQYQYLLTPKKAKFVDVLRIALKINIVEAKQQHINRILLSALRNAEIRKAGGANYRLA